jgi:Mn-containing catalase
MYVKLLCLTYFAFYNHHHLLQSGGPDGESGAAMRYLSQRYAMPNDMVRAVLTDIGTEESEPSNYSP